MRQFATAFEERDRLLYEALRESCRRLCLLPDLETPAISAALGAVHLDDSPSTAGPECHHPPWAYSGIRTPDVQKDLEVRNRGQDTISGLHIYIFHF